MRSRAVRIVLAAFALIMGGLAVWTFWVPYRAPGGVEIASGRLVGCPVWSPDGRWLAFYARTATRGPHGPPYAAYVAGADGSGSKRLVARAFPVAWRKDPLRLVVMELYDQGGDRQIALSAVDAKTRITEPLGLSFNVGIGYVRGVSPLLRYLAVWRSPRVQGDPAELVIISGDGLEQKLRQRPYFELQPYPSWSPDEKTLALATEAGIEIIEVGTGSRTALVRTKRGAFGVLAAAVRLAWSPDGEEIAFSAQRGDLPWGALRWAESQCWRCATSKTRWMQKPAFFFQHNQGRHTRSTIYSLRVRDGKVKELLRLPLGNTVGELAWSPDGDKLAALCHLEVGFSLEKTVRVFDIPAAKPGDWRLVEEVVPGLRKGD